MLCSSIDFFSGRSGLRIALIPPIFGLIFIWTCIILSGKLPEIKIALKNKSGMKETAMGAFIGPYLGVTFSMIAVAFTYAGIAQTLMSLMPIIILPMLYFVYKQSVTKRGILGAFISVIGVLCP